ncbi:hypothetical protein FQN54_004249 [Arachnomyces sp. PD_36]|nr:hypothetical protein FQN54_004249 [Arachnomyces sp. PD_36]
MKFAHNYSEALEKENYPSRWLTSALSYKQLKKCIKKVQKELSSLGLDPETLNILWQTSGEESVKGSGDPGSVGFQYLFSGTSNFHPKLIFVLNPKDGSPVDAWLSPATREYLRTLTKNPESSSSEPSRSTSPVESDDGCRVSLDEYGSLNSSLAGDPAEPPEGYQTVEIPLHSDSEFFQILRKEMSALANLQEREQKDLSQQVTQLGKEIGAITQTSSGRSKRTVYAWRDILRLYTESQVFFSTGETNTGQRNVATAQQQLQAFQENLARDRRIGKLGKESQAMLAKFMRINALLLQNLKFQDINRTALMKILKKFDKQTALRARSSLPEFLPEPFLSQKMAKAVCYTISEEILSIVPQVNDYLCPICFSIAFKPVRLRCQHVFCIRCLITMQRARQDHCPLCRRGVVMEACSDNLDNELIDFLKTTFPKETKAKQKDNERAAGFDIYGDAYGKCCVM